jgi:antirestriction protein
MTDLRIYAACLASYNNGVLHGAWIDCDGKDADDIQDEINAMLRASRFPNVMVEHEGQQVPSAEEFAIHDHEGFGRLLGEYDGLAKVATLAEGLCGDHGRAFRWLVEDIRMDTDDALSRADEVIIAESNAHNMLEDYAHEYVAETMDLDSLPELIRHNIDYEGIGRDMNLNGEWVEAEDSDGRFLVVNASAF